MTHFSAKRQSLTEQAIFGECILLISALRMIAYSEECVGEIWEGVGNVSYPGQCDDGWGGTLLLSRS